jgi:hypothetical protein
MTARRSTANWETSGNKGADRMFKIALTWVNDAWGGRQSRLGADLYAAVLSHQVLILLDHQDEDGVSDSTVRAMIPALRGLIDNEVNGLFGEGSI